MRFKLDENLSVLLSEALAEKGHEVFTAEEEHLLGASDPQVLGKCLAERICLVTVDQDFAQIIDYPPHEYAGIVVLRHPRPSLSGLRRLLGQLATQALHESPSGRLWIVEPLRIRIHEKTDP